MADLVPPGRGLRPPGGTGRDRLPGEGGRPPACDRSPLIGFFPTEKETFLGFLVQGPYRTTPARDNIGEHDPSNQVLVRETAALACDVLRNSATMSG